MAASPAHAVDDMISNLPKDPPIYKNVGFDPEPLERAAELSKSRGFRPAAELSDLRHQGKEFKEKRLQAMAEARKLSQYKRHAESEAKKRWQQEKARLDKEVADFKGQLAKQRGMDATHAEKQLQDARQELKDKFQKELKAMQDDTARYEAGMKEALDLMRVKLEYEGKIKAERENRMYRLDMLKAELQEKRKTMMLSIQEAGSTVGAGLQDFLSNSERRSAAVLTISAIALGVYSAKVSTGIAGRLVESRLGKPSLVRETSRDTGLSMLTGPVRRLVSRLSGGGAHKDIMDGIVLEDKVATRLRSVADSTRHTKRNRAPFRHLLLYGPPGTGKTLFAKALAQYSGMEYAILTGGDVAPLGRDAVTEIHKVFEWANTSRRGVLLFVDESDAFLRRRSTEFISEDMRNALNAFLFRTGEASDKFMIVYASNQPEQFDWAINDRIDEMVEFVLPGFEERRRMIAYYMHSLLTSPSQATPITIADDVNEATVEAAVHATEHFSGREIAKLAVAWQAAAYGTSPPTLDQHLLQEVLDQHLKQKKQKEVWASADMANYTRAVTGGSTAK